MESQRAWPTRCVVRRPFAQAFVGKAPAASFDIFPRNEYLHACVCLCVSAPVLVQGNDGHGWGAKVVTRDTFVEGGVIKLKLCDRQSGFP